MNLRSITNGANGSKKVGKPILTGLMYTLVMVLASAFIFALLLYFTSLSDSHLPLISYIITGTSLTVGGFVSGKKAGAKGWYYGGVTGAIYGVLLAIIGFLAFNAAFTLRDLSLAVLSFLFGALGGILGVNSRK